MKRRISAKVQLMYTALFILIILMTVAISYISSIRQLERQVIGSNQNVLSQISKRVDSTLQEIDLTTINLLRSNDTRSFLRTPVRILHSIYWASLCSRISWATISQPILI